MTWAAAVACYTLLALAPLLVIAMKVLTVVLHKRAATQQLQSQVVSWMGPATANAFNEIIEKVSRSGAGTVSTIISLVLIVVSVGGVRAELQHAMNRIWKVKPKPGQALWGFLRARVLSLLILVVATGLMFASVAVMAWMQHLSATLGIGWKSITWAIDIAVSLGVLDGTSALTSHQFRRPDRLAGDVGRWVDHLGAVRARAVLARGLFPVCAPASHLGARLAGAGHPDLDLLLVHDCLFRGGIHAGVCQQVRAGWNRQLTPAAEGVR